MKLFETDASLRWLFCFTHPDDEIAIAAWMRRLTSGGAQVAAGWSVSDNVREAEADMAMRHIGVHKSHMFFHKMPDGSACDHLPELAKAWVEVIQQVQPHRLVVGAFECGHVDHDATNYAVRKAVQALDRPQLAIYEIPLYHTYLTKVPVINRFADPSGESVLELTPDEWLFKKEISKRYPSQKIGSLLVWYTALGWVKGRPPALCRTERMRVQKHFDYTTPNLPEPLRSKVIASPTWQRWRAATDLNPGFFKNL